MRVNEYDATMPLNLYNNIYESGSVPGDWTSRKGGTVKRPVRNRTLARYLQTLIPGRWRKVYKYGNGGKIHYFEHESGQVAGVKYYPSDDSRS